MGTLGQMRRGARAAGAVPAQHNIRGIPTLMLFKGGQLAATKVGALSKAQLTAFVEPHL